VDRPSFSAEDLERPPGWPRWLRALWYHAAFYRQTWRASVISSFLFPILYLASMGIGVGHLVSAHTGLVQGRTYLHFVAPGLLAITAMQLATEESMWPVLGALKWVRTYHAAVATPLEPEDVAIGKLGWVAVRLTLTTALYAVIIALFGAVSSLWALTLPLVGLLTGMAFTAPLVAYAATTDSDASFTMVYRFSIIPMFLFSATFYPVSVYPASIRWIVQLMPLYHGVALARSAAFGTGALGPTLAHVGVLAVMATLGVALARRNLRRRLVD
jgi:lipooligosaccharide transport system permease protein